MVRKNMQINQQEFPQETNRWDFSRKKTRENRKEKIINFLGGLFLTPLLLFLTFQLVDSFPFFITIGAVLFVDLILIIYSRNKNRYMFFGVLLISLLVALGCLCLFVSIFQGLKDYYM